MYSSHAFRVSTITPALLKQYTAANLINHSMHRSSLSPTNLFSTKTTGAFKKRLIDVYPSQTHYKRALKGLKNVRVDSTIKNIR
jgi:hypothetical protein